MAILHFAVKSISRGKGHSATAAAAYRAGLAITDTLTGERHDYTRRHGVIGADMLAPTGAVEWATDPHRVWDEAEQIETRKNARVGREIVLALPHELDADARRDLAHEVGQLLVDRYGVAVLVALHAPDKGGDDRNFHAHLLMTSRQMGPDGFTGYAAKAFDDFKAGPVELKAVRAEVATRINQALERAGVADRVDPRPLNEQKAEAAANGDFEAVAALDRPATKHEGKATTRARRKGNLTPRAQRNDTIKDASARRWNNHNRRFETLKAEAQADGRLTPVDEQAAHAQALLERTHEGRERLRKAHTDTPTTNPRSARHGTRTSNKGGRGPAAPLTRGSSYRPGDRNNRHGNGLGALPAVRPLNRDTAFGGNGGHTGGPGADPARSSDLLRPNASRHPSPGSALQRIRAERVARAPAAATPTGRIQGNGTKEGNRAAKAANEYISMLDALVRDAIRNAIAWGQNDNAPAARALARDFQRAAGEAVSAKAAHDDARTAHRKARRDRHEADHLKPEAKGVAKAVGWKTAAVRQGERAHKEAMDHAAEAKAWRHESGKAQKLAEAEAEKHQKALLDAWKKAHPEHIDRFPGRRTPAPVPGPAPTLGQRPGSVSGFHPPQLEPPRPPSLKNRH